MTKEELEKENAELIHENARLVTVIDKSKSCGISPLNYLIIKNLDDQLTKAKEILKAVVDFYPTTTATILCEAEKFISEVEK